MKPLSNSTIEECERIAYIEGDLEKIKLIQQIQDLMDDVNSCGGYIDE